MKRWFNPFIFIIALHTKQGAFASIFRIGCSKGECVCVCLLKFMSPEQHSPQIQRDWLMKNKVYTRSLQMARTHTHKATQWYTIGTVRQGNMAATANRIRLRNSAVLRLAVAPLRQIKRYGEGNKMTLVSSLPSLRLCFCYPFNHSEKEQTALHTSPGQRSTSPSTNDGEKATGDWEAMSEAKQKDPAVGFFYSANITSSFTKHCAKESNESCMRRQLTFKSHFQSRLRTNQFNPTGFLEQIKRTSMLKLVKMYVKARDKSRPALVWR